MTELETLAKRFGVSQPVFKVTLSTSGKELIFETKDAYDSGEELTEDPIAKLLAERYSETLNKRETRFEAYVDVDSAFYYIVREFIQFTLNHGVHKKPKQNKLYKWLNQFDCKYNQPLSDGFVTLYRYAVRNGALNDSNPHTINVLAVLELMREKYEQK